MNEAQLISTKEGRRLLTRASPVFFATYYLGLDYAAHQEKWLNALDELTEEARTKKIKKKLLLLAPRDHGKSLLSIAYTLRRIVLDRDVKVLWISASAGQSEKRVRLIKSYLLSEKIQEDWGSDDMPPFKTDTTKWIATQIYVNREKDSVDPTLEAIGCGGSITGAHVSCIIMDDLEDDKTTYSSANRERTRDWLKSTIMPMLEKSGVMLVVGTRKHYDDVYEHMISDPTYNVIIDPAIKKWPSHYEFKMKQDKNGRDIVEGIEIEGESEVLWPEHRPIEYLLQERQAVGSLLFSREFMNQVQSDENAIFKPMWLDIAKKNGSFLSYGELPHVGRLQVVQGWDLSLVTSKRIADKNDTDYTVGITLAKDGQGNRYLLSLVRKRGLTPAELKALIVSEYERFKDLVSIVMIEKNAFGQLHLLNLRKTTDLPLRQHLTTAGAKSNLWTGVPAMSSLFENGKMHLPYREINDQRISDDLCRELHQLGKANHDDMVMSLWIAECALRDSTFQYEISFSDDETYDMFGNRVSDTRYEQSALSTSVSAIWNSFPWYNEDEVH